MLKKRTILSFYQCASCRTLAIELVRQNANSTYLSKQSGHKESSWPSGIRAAGLIWNTLSAKSWLTLITNVRLLYHTSAVILLWCINFRFNNYSIHDNAWHCIQYQYRWWWCSRVKCRLLRYVPAMSGHLSCTDTFAWSRGCPFMTGRGRGGKLEPLRNMANMCHSLKPILCFKLLYWRKTTTYNHRKLSERYIDP